MMDLGRFQSTVAGRIFAVGALLLATAVASQAQAPGELPRPSPLPVAGPSDEVGPVKLRNESVDQVLDLLERWTGRILLRPTSLPAGAYTLTIDQPVKREEAIRALETLLTLNGVAVSPQGDRYIKVVPLSLARTEAPLYIEGSARNLPPSGRIASKLFTPKFLRISEFLPQISALLNPGVGAAPVAFEKANSALIIDSVSNLQRVESLLEQLDRPFLEQNLTTKSYALTSAKASNVVNQLRTLLGGALQTQLGATTTYQADDRTNQILLISDPRQQPLFDDLIAKLDIAGDPNTRNEVMFLKNANAKDIATLLSQLVQGANQSRKTNDSRASGSTPPAPVPAAGPAAANAAVVAVASAGIEGQDFSDMLTILAEERSNSLIVSGTVDDIRLIRNIVEKVDVLLAQVRIEVVIAEVTLNDEATSGISAMGLNVRANKLVGFSGAGAGTDIKNGTLTPDGNGGTDLAVDIGLSTTPRKNNTVILSQPAITTTHNKEAEIFVGEQRPVISAYISDTSGSTGIGNSNLGHTTVTPTEIGIRLTVKPLIGNDGSVQLEIAQDVSDVIGEVTVDGNPQPIIGKRETKSFVSVRSGEIIVLGGLQRTSRGKTTSRLGPLPIIGDLLGTRKRTDNRTDLVFFLRPYVLTNTAADNADAFRRVEAGPQRDAVREAIGPSLQGSTPSDLPPATPKP
jgi:general secretion pathway protein D